VKTRKDATQTKSPDPVRGAVGAEVDLLGQLLVTQSTVVDERHK
jgi:hypothetical protein